MGIDLLEDMGSSAIFSLPLYLWRDFLYLESDSQLILSPPPKYRLYDFSHESFPTSTDTPPSPSIAFASFSLGD